MLTRYVVNQATKAVKKKTLQYHRDFAGGTSGKEPTCQCRRPKRHGFDPELGKMPWRRKMTTHSNSLAWRIPWTEEPGGLQSMELQRVRQD